MTLYDIYTVLQDEKHLNLSNVDAFYNIFFNQSEALRKDTGLPNDDFTCTLVYVGSRNAQLIIKSPKLSPTIKLENLKNLKSLLKKKILASPAYLWFNIESFYSKHLEVGDSVISAKRESLYQKLKKLCGPHIMEFIGKLDICLEDDTYKSFFQKGQNDDLILLTYLLFLDAAGLFVTENFIADTGQRYLEYMLDGYQKLFKKDKEWRDREYYSLLEESDNQIVYLKLHQLFLHMIFSGRIICSKCKDIPCIYECVLRKYNALCKKDSSHLLDAINERKKYTEIFHPLIPENIIENLDTKNRNIYDQICATPAMNRCMKLMMLFPKQYISIELLKDLDGASGGGFEQAVVKLFELGVLEWSPDDGYRPKYAWSILMESELKLHPLPLAFFAEHDFPVLNLLYHQKKIEILYSCVEFHQEWLNWYRRYFGEPGEGVPYAELYRLTIYSILILLKLDTSEQLSEGKKESLTKEFRKSVNQITENESKLEWIKRAREVDITI